MKKYNNYINDKEKEYEFFFKNISHLNELEIKFDFFTNKKYLFYFYGEDYMFDYNKYYGNEFHINSDKIWSIFEDAFYLKNENIYDIFYKIINKYFDIKDIKIKKRFLESSYYVERNFSI